MFVHFLYQALCANVKLVKPKTSGKYAFDIVYEDDNGTPHSTTNDKGYYVYYRKINNGNPQAWEVLKDMGKIGSFISGYEVSVTSSQDSKGQSIDVFVSVFSNTDFDVGVYCDTDFDTQGDNVKLVKKFNGNGVTFQSTSRPMTFSLKNNLYTSFDGQSSDVDSIYTGLAASSETQTAIGELMLKNEFPDTTQDNQDSALAFSWRNKKNTQGRYLKLGFKVVVGQDLGNVAPSIKDTTTKEKLSQQFTLTFEVTELNNQKVTVMVNDLIEKSSFKCGEFQSDGNLHTSGTVSCSRTFNKDGFFKYNAYAVDSDGANSNTTPDTQVLLDGIQPPICNVLTKLPLREYTEKDKIIFIEYEIDDENSVTVSYQFDDMEKVTSENKDTSAPNNKVQTSMNIQIPSKLELNKPHTLYFWATDNLGKDSFINEMPFKYSSSVNKPAITDIYLSTEKVENGKITRAVVFGQATDPNEGDLIRIFAKLPGLPDKELGNVTATNSKTPFAFFFYFPSKEVGHYNISFYAKDVNDHISEENITLPMIVWNPEAPQSPDLIGKIIDVSADLKAGTNALFNLRYQDRDGFDRKMTFNDEGFFCAVRTFNDTKLTSRLGQYYFKKNNERLARFDEFVVRYEITSNKITKFLETKIKVRNERFFPRLFELSLFADSDLSDDDNSPIKSREDGRGIVVSSEKNKLRYTVFTQDYFDSPAATRTFITNNLQRPNNNNEIRLDDIPFFNTSKTETGQANSAYAVSWMSQVIPAGEEVSFTLAFAAHDNVKTPPRLIDNTNWKNSYSPDEEAFINISIRDAEPNEALTLHIFENGNSYYTDSWTATNNNFLIKKMNFSTDQQRYNIYIYVQEKDASTSFPSNPITKSVSISGSPVLTLDTNQFKSFYHNNEKIKIKGTVYDDNAQKVQICYRFIKGSSDEILSAQQCFEDKPITPKTNNNIDYEIGFNKIYPSDENWGIVVYAVDNLAVSNNFTHHFNLNVYSPPKLIQAGLSRKSASKNSRILAYAVLNDQQNDFIDIFVKISGSDYPATPVHHLNANPTPGEDYPIAFHWQVPSDAKVGAIDVTFLIKDSEGLPSNEITKTLVITGN